MWRILPQLINILIRCFFSFDLYWILFFPGSRLSLNHPTNLRKDSRYDDGGLSRALSRATYYSEEQKKKKEPHSRRPVFGITSQDVVVADATANECEVKEWRFTCQFFARLAALAVAHPTIFTGICPGCQPKIVSRRCLRRQQIRNSLLAERVDLGWLCCKRWVGEGNAWITDK